MNKDNLEKITKLKGEWRAAKAAYNKEIERINTELKPLKIDCDHQYPDGSSAIQHGVGHCECESGCQICTRNFGWLDAPKKQSYEIGDNLYIRENEVTSRAN